MLLKFVKHGTPSVRRVEEVVRPSEAPNLRAPQSEGKVVVTL
jgi:hypothetical protein